MGYVHQSMGAIAHRASREERLTTTFANLPPPEPEAAPELAAQSAPSIDAADAGIYSACVIRGSPNR